MRHKVCGNQNAKNRSHFWTTSRSKLELQMEMEMETKLELELDQLRCQQ